MRSKKKSIFTNDVSDPVHFAGIEDVQVSKVRSWGMTKKNDRGACSTFQGLKKLFC